MVYNKGVFKAFTYFLLILFGISVVSANANVLDVRFSEYIYERVLYNPLETGDGLYYDANENQTDYTITGSIVIENKHSTQAMENIVLNISNIANIVNNTIAYQLGSRGYVSEYNEIGDFMILAIPDLAAGANATFNYTVNTTTVKPVLNFTTSYDKSRVFSGKPIAITDTVQNVMNTTLYTTDTCIYDINITQDAQSFDNEGDLLNFTFDSASISGPDATNVTFDGTEQTLYWDLYNNGCLNSSNDITNIAYNLDTPGGLSLSQYYIFTNTTINYKTNNTYSRIVLSDINSVVDMELNFEKYMDELLDDDNATWRISSEVFAPSDITVNLTQVSLWVSVRNATGTGFTNPSVYDVDTVDGSGLSLNYTPNLFMNNTLNPWNNTGSEWYLNYTFSASPIVWMDLTHNVVNDGLQMTNRSISYGDEQLYIKEIYIATGYWLEITKNITRLTDDNFSIFIQVQNIGSSPTPKDQVVQVYNFLPNTFNVTSAFLYSTTTWYNTADANETLNDPIYNGTMFQYAIIANENKFNASLDKFGTGNDTWSVTYNVTGYGEFAFEDLFLTGVDPLSVDEKGSTLAVLVEGTYSVLSAGFEYILGGAAVLIGVLVLLL